MDSLDRATFDARYHLLDLLGEGAFGKVFLAKQASLQRLVAVKIYSPDQKSWNPDTAARFVREALILGKLSHSRVLKIFDAGLLSEAPFLVVEYLDGQDLARRLERESPLPLDEAVRVCLAIAEALEYLHGQQIIHRDLKPANVLLGASGAVKVSDFGIARPMDGSPALTSDGVILGTPHYMAPEVIRSGRAEPASDLHALGTILYVCVHGSLPFDTSGTLADVFHRKLNEPPFGPGPQVPTTLASLLRGCLELSASNRPTAAEVRGTLERAHTAGIGIASGGIKLTPGPQPVAAGPVAAGPVAWGARTIASPAGTSRTAATEGTDRSSQSTGARLTSDGTKTAARPLDAAPSDRRLSLALAGGATIALFLALLAGLGTLSRSPEPSRDTPVQPIATARGATTAAATVFRDGDPEALETLAATISATKIEALAEYGGKHLGALDTAFGRSALYGSMKRALEEPALHLAGALPAEKLRPLLMPLHTLRLAAVQFILQGQKPPLLAAEVADAAFPLHLSAPPVEAILKVTSAGQPVGAGLEPRNEEDEMIFGRSALPAIRCGIPALGRDPRCRAWWVLDVDQLKNRCVLDLYAHTSSGPPLRFPFGTACRLGDGDVRHTGQVSMGFDPGLLATFSGTVSIGFRALRGPSDIRPMIRRVSIFQSVEPDLPPRRSAK